MERKNVDKDKTPVNQYGLSEKAVLWEGTKGNGDRVEQLDYYLNDHLHDQHVHEWIEKNLTTGVTTEGYQIIPNSQSSSNS